MSGMVETERIDQDLMRPCCVQSVARDGGLAKADVVVPREYSVDVYVNGSKMMQITCTREYVTDLVIGRLFTEGMIRGIAEIEQVLLLDQARRADVRIKEGPGDRFAACPKGIADDGWASSLLATLPKGALRKKVVPIEWHPAWLFQLAEAFAEDTPMHRITRGAHSCYLARENRILRCCEDIGRHNAFDKVIGWALRKGVDLRACTILTSGRIPIDMLTKAVCAGVPVLASKTVPTDKTIELARACDITLICSVNSKGMDVFNDPWGASLSALRRGA